MLNFQQELKRKYNRSNAETVLDVREIPGNNQITRLLDNMEPEWFAETFNNNLKLAEKYGALEEYRVLDGGVLIALDGVWYYSSQNIHCEHCPHKSKDGETTYYHSMVAGAVVKPGSGVVLPAGMRLYGTRTDRGSGIAGGTRLNGGLRTTAGGTPG